MRDKFQSHKTTDLPLWQSFLIANVEGLRSCRRRHKVQMLREYMVNSGTLVAAFTETHLNPSIKEAEITMKDYSVYRADRLNRTKGGVVVYLRKEAAADAQLLASGSDGTVEYLMVYSKSYNMLIINVYRPPQTSTSCFLPVLRKLKECLLRLGGATPSIVFCGDLNLPGTCWETGENSLGSRDDRAAVEAVIQFQSDFFLTEIVKQPTRGNSHLDVCFTNSPDKFLNVETEDTVISDHKLVFARSIFKEPGRPESNFYERAGSEMERLNFFHKDVDWGAINQELSTIDWSVEFAGASFEQKHQKIHYLLEKICLHHVPRRPKKKRNVIPRDRKILMKKRSKLLKEPENLVTRAEKLK